MENNQGLNPTPPVLPPVGTPSSEHVSFVEKPKPKFPLALIIGIVIFLLIAGSAAGFYVYKQQSSNTARKLTPQPIVQKQVPSPSHDPTVDWKEYKNANFKLSFKYPSDLYLTPIEQQGQLDMEGERLLIISPKKDKKNGNLHEITIRMNPILGGSPTIKEIKRLIDSISTSTNSAIVKTRISLGDLNGYSLSSSESGSFYTKDIGTASTKNVFQIIVYPSEDKKSPDKTMPIYDLIISTFKFTDSQKDLPESLEEKNSSSDALTLKTSVEFLFANLRYQTTYPNLPWEKAGPCKDSVGSVDPIGVPLLQGVPCINDLIKEDELKQLYLVDSIPVLDLIYFSESENNTVVCYKPKSKAKQLNINTHFTSAGKPESNCKSNGGINECYSCCAGWNTDSTIPSSKPEKCAQGF